MDVEVEKLFARYEEVFNRALVGDSDPDAIASLYATDVIGAAPAGVRAARNDDKFRASLAQGYAQYRAIGTREMRIRALHRMPIDTHHCIVRVGWAATYARADLPATTIDFDVHYLVQVLKGEARVFGWITGDEQALLRQHGIV